MNNFYCAFKKYSSIINFAEEIADLTDQIGEGGKSIHELEKAKRTLEHERNEMQAALEEAEGAVEGEESKVLRLQVEVAQMKQDFERRLTEKEEEIDNQRWIKLPRFQLDCFYICFFLDMISPIMSYLTYLAGNQCFLLI